MIVARKFGISDIKMSSQLIAAFPVPRELITERAFNYELCDVGKITLVPCSLFILNSGTVFPQNTLLFV